MSRILAALSLLTLFPAFASASPARVEAMNVPGDYVKDYTGVFTYLSGVSASGNIVWAQPDGVTGNQGMGALLGNLWEGRLGTWGVNLRRFAPSLGQPMFGDPITTTMDPSNSFFFDPNVTGEAFDVMWGKKMGSGTLGLRLNRSFTSNDTTGGTTEGNGEFQRNIWGAGAGFGFAMNEYSDVELSALFQNRTFKGSNQQTPDATADDGGATYQLAGRMMIKAGGNLVVTPVAKYYKFDLSMTDGTPAGATDRTLSGWTAGLSGNWSVGSDDVLILGAQFVGNHAESQTGTNPKLDVKETFYPNVFLGMENHINSWLTLRAGAQNAMFLSVRGNSNNIAGTETTQKQHAFSFNMGAGVKLGTLQLDATLAPDFWNNPLRVLGVSDAPSASSQTAFPRVSATYSF